MMMGGASKLGLLLGVAATAVRAELKVDFACTNENCTEKIKVAPQALHIGILTEAGKFAQDVKGEVTGPGVFIIRDLDADCTCEIELPTLDHKITCQDQDMVGVGVDVPEGKTVVHFSGDPTCFKILAEISNPLEDVIELVAKSATSINSITVSNSVASSVSASAFGAGTKMSSVMANGLTPAVCDKDNFGLQLVVAERLPHTQYSREAQLLMSNFAEIFENFKAGLVYYGGEGECFKQVVDVGDFPQQVMEEFAAAMKAAAESDVAAPLGNPLAALQHIAEEVKWLEPAEGKNILRVVLIEVTTHSSDYTADCPTKDPAVIASELAEKGITVLFFANEETETEVKEFQSANGIIGHVHLMKEGKTMISINTLVRMLKEELKKMCGEGVYRRRLMFSDN